MISVILSLVFAYWLKKEARAFPSRINQHVYHDYHDLVNTDISVEDFKLKSQLQLKPTNLDNGFFILFPLNTLLLDSPPLIIITIVLLYLSLLDYLYYLADIKYITVIFMCALWHCLFYQTSFIHEAILTLFTTMLFFLVFYVISLTLFKKESIGMGDILLLIALAPLFTLEEMILLLLYASLAGLLFSLIHFILTKQKLRRLPFIPFISLSTFILFIAKIP